MSRSIRPNYGHGCFADLPNLIQSCLTDQPAPSGLNGVPDNLLRKYDTVILLMIDAFGWQLFQRVAARHPFLQRLTQEATVAQWTSQFPSTTAAHVTCIHTGLTPSQSGVFEWEYYEPTVDATITPLLFSYGGLSARDLLQQTGVTPAQLYPAQSLHEQLRSQGVTTHVFQHREYTPSTYTDWVCRGAEMHPYMTLAEAFYNLRQTVQHTPKPAYCFLYFDKIDALCHLYGPESMQVTAEVEGFLYLLERALIQPGRNEFRNTLMLLTADHGQMPVNPQTTVFLNTDPRFAGLERLLRRNSKGELIGHGGSRRDLFLYVKEEVVDEAQIFLADRLAGIADVQPVQPLIDECYFGPLPPSAAFLNRVSPLVIFPHDGQNVWWYEKGRYGMRYYGLHGGLSPQEMAIPLCLIEFD
ncbi:MAG: alkaline phosphatase family protein [Caldilineaceae bacterium]|nr:alkaline phosphatase family protein [Caldilineaceae bacterium]